MENKKYNCEYIIKRFEDLRIKRYEWETIWDKCAMYTLPRAKYYKSHIKVSFDDTAKNALSTFSSVLESTITPRTIKWHSLSTGNTELDNRVDVSQWLEYVTDVLFSYRYDPESNFGNQMVEAYFSLGCFGTAAIFIDTFKDGRPRYQNIPIYEIFIDENNFGQVDTVFREFELTARQAYQQFGDEVSDQIKQDCQDNNTCDKKYKFIHAVFPDKNYNEEKDIDEFPFYSFYIEYQTKNLVLKSGYKTLPYAISRFYSGFREIYGRSPAYQVLNSIIRINEIQKTLLRSGQLAVAPPYLASNKASPQGYSIKPETIIRGGIDEDGTPMVVPLQLDSSRFNIGQYLLEDCKNNINTAFFITLFQILSETPTNQTATEVLQRAQEQAQLISPVIGRQQDELILPIIKREINILIDLNVIPQPPEDVTEVVPKYTTKIMDQLNSKKGLAILQALEATMPLMQSYPNLANNLNMDKVFREIYNGFGAPSDVLRTEEEVAAINQQQEEQAAQESQLAQIQQIAQLADPASKAVKNLSDTGIDLGSMLNGQ